MLSEVQAGKFDWRKGFTGNSYRNMILTLTVNKLLYKLSCVINFLNRKFLGTDFGVFGMVIAAAVGCITLISGFVAFPFAASLLSAGAGYAQIAIFISTLMMVGIATLPLEIKCFDADS